MWENWCSSSEGFILLSSSFEYNVGCPPDNPVTEKYLMRKSEWDYLTSPGNFQLIQQQNWLTRLSSALALHRLCISFALSLLLLKVPRQPLLAVPPAPREFPAFCVREASLLHWPFGLCVKTVWAQTGPTSVPLSVALPPLVAVHLSTQYSRTILAPLLQNDHSAS